MNKKGQTLLAQNKSVPNLFHLSGTVSNQLFTIIPKQHQNVRHRSNIYYNRYEAFNIQVINWLFIQRKRDTRAISFYLKVKHVRIKINTTDILRSFFICNATFIN